MCALASAVPHPLPSFAPALTGFLFSASSLLLLRPAAFSLLPQVPRPADLEESVKEMMRKNDIIAFPLRASVLHSTVCEAQRWDASLLAVLWQHRLYKESGVAVSDLHVCFVFVSALDFNFYLSAFHTTTEEQSFSNSVTHPLSSAHNPHLSG